MELLSNIDIDTLHSGSTDANDIWGWKDVEYNNYYAIIGLNTGTCFVNITNPKNPSIVGHLPTHTANNFWRDIKVYNNYAFIVSEADGHGMQIFDLKLLRDITSKTSFTATYHYNYNISNIHNLVINEETGTAVLVGGTNGCGGGLHILDISNSDNYDTPSAMYQACCGGDGYTHDAHCVVYKGPDPNYSSQEICFCSNEDTIT